MNIHICILYFSKLLACVIVHCDLWIMNPIHSLSFPIKLVFSIWYLQRKAYNILTVVKKKRAYIKNTLLWDLKKCLKSNYSTMSNTVPRFKQLFFFWHFIFSLSIASYMLFLCTTGLAWNRSNYHKLERSL